MSPNLAAGNPMPSSHPELSLAWRLITYRIRAMILVGFCWFNHRHFLAFCWCTSTGVDIYAGAFNNDPAIINADKIASNILWKDWTCTQNNLIPLHRQILFQVPYIVGALHFPCGYCAQRVWSNCLSLHQLAHHEWSTFHRTVFLKDNKSGFYSRITHRSLSRLLLEIRKNQFTVIYQQPRDKFFWRFTSWLLLLIPSKTTVV